MWKRISCLLAIVIMAVTCLTLNVGAGNEITNEPYDTKVLGLEGSLVSSSMAYEGVKVLNLGFNTPEDIYIADDNCVYIADSGNKVVYKYDPLNTSDVKVIGKNILNKPQGVCLDSKGNVYVADSGAKKVFVFNSDFELINEIGRPNAALFGSDSQYTPTKVAVDRAGTIYITSEGNSTGLLRISPDGEFSGYFARNTTVVSFDFLIGRFFASKEEKEAKYSLSPKANTNLAIDNKNIVYTIANGTSSDSLKKFNVNGTNLIAGGALFSDNYQDVAVDDEGFIYTVSGDKSGVVTVRDKDGNILFTFGNTSTNGYSMGHFSSASGIDVDSNGNIWVLDRTGKNIQVFTKTLFATTVMEAMRLYNLGDYEAAAKKYNEILAQNASFVQAYIGLGNIAQRNQDYEMARYYFRIANHKAGYSDAFWEIRDNWLGQNLLWIAIVVVALVLLNVFKVKQFIYTKTGFNPEAIKEKIRNNSYYKEFAYIPRMLKKPNDTIYDIKFLQKIRFSTALIFFALFIFINILCDTTLTAYIFRTQLDSQVNFAFELLKWGLIIVLIAIGNYLVSSLQKGEGFFRDIFIGIMVAFAPIFILKLPLSIVSNVLTYNESYIVDLITIAMWAWSIFNVILVIKSVHNYTVKELIVNLVLTALAVIILVFLFLMVYILFMQFYDFVAGLIKEAIMR